MSGGLEHVLGGLERLVAQAAAVQHRGDLDAGVLLHLLLETQLAVEPRLHLRLADDADLALPVDGLGDVLGREPAAREVVGRDVRDDLPALRRDVGGEDGDVRAVGQLDGRADAFESAGQR